MAHIKRKVKVNIYDSEIYIIVTDDFLSVTNKLLKKQNEPEIQMECHGMFLTFDDHYCIILKQQDLSLNTITHECLHASLQILKDTGIQISYDNDEALAYLIAFILSKVVEQITKAGITINNGSSKKC